jgi:hypothetical protein
MVAEIGAYKNGLCLSNWPESAKNRPSPHNRNPSPMFIIFGNIWNIWGQCKNYNVRNGSIADSLPPLRALYQQNTAISFPAAVSFYAVWCI